MKTIKKTGFRLCIFFLLFFPFIAVGQWSVLTSDPRPQSHLYQRFTKEEWNASNFAKPEEMKWFNDARFGMFITFGLSAYVNKDLSWPIVYSRKAPDSGHGAYPDSVWTKWPSKFKLEKFNADEWVKIAKEAGMKYIVVIAKHHDGFHMWDTKYSNFKITNTPFGRDYLKEVADACHKSGMRFGIYYSQRDWHHPDYAPVDPSTIKKIPDAPYYEALPGKQVKAGPSHQKYIDYQFNVVRELCTKYGKVDLFWFDANWWGGMFTAEMWDAEKLTRMIRKLQPGILINNRTSLPGDFDTPEQRIGMHQERSWESCMTLNGSWAYSPAPVKSVKLLIHDLLNSAAGNGNVLLSWGALWNGDFDAAQTDTLLEMGKWLKKYGTSYYGTRGGPWVPNRQMGSTYKADKIYIYVYDWKNGDLNLPVLQENKVLKASFLNVNEKLSWKQSGNYLHFVAPAHPDGIATIVELTMAKNINASFGEFSASIFSDPAYGTKIKTMQIKADSRANNHKEIDLGKIENVTGINIHPSNVKINVSVSVNGKEWQNLNTSGPVKKEISLTTFIAGAHVLGRQIRYIRLQTLGKSAGFKVDVYSK
jgi:alpha-L-fucosidase